MYTGTPLLLFALGVPFELITNLPFTLRAASEFKYNAPATSLSPSTFSVLIVKVEFGSILIVIFALAAIARATSPVPIPLRLSGSPLECGLIATFAPSFTSIVVVPPSISRALASSVVKVTLLFSSKII